jgi:hypothetical protein
MQHIQSTPFAPAFKQLELIETEEAIRAIPSVAHARGEYGGAAQRIVYEALDIIPIPINGRYKVNFDGYSNGVYYEIKSVRLSQKVVLYKWRVEKEQESGASLTYALVGHKVKEAPDTDKMWKGFQQHGVDIYLIPATVIHSLAVTCPLNTMKSTLRGHNREGYRDGYYNLTWKDATAFSQFMYETKPIVNNREITCRVYGYFYLPENLR